MLFRCKDCHYFNKNKKVCKMDMHRVAPSWYACRYFKLEALVKFAEKGVRQETL